MGTNYYWIEPCEHCMRVSRLHIGKQSFGWVFLLRLHPADGLGSWAEWKQRMKLARGHVEDDYDKPVSVQAIIDMVEHPKRDAMRNADVSGSHAVRGETWDESVYEFS